MRLHRSASRDQIGIRSLLHLHEKSSSTHERDRTNTRELRTKAGMNISSRNIRFVLRQLSCPEQKRGSLIEFTIPAGDNYRAGVILAWLLAS